MNLCNKWGSLRLILLHQGIMSCCQTTSQEKRAPLVSTGALKVGLSTSYIDFVIHHQVLTGKAEAIDSSDTKVEKIAELGVYIGKLKRFIGAGCVAKNYTSPVFQHQNVLNHLEHLKYYFSEISIYHEIVSSY